MRWFDKECIVKRNTKTMGTHNRPVYTLGEVARYKVALDTQRGSNVTIQAQPQAVINERFVVYVPAHADIKPKDVLVIEGIEYVAGVPISYRTHKEVPVLLNEEV